MTPESFDTTSESPSISLNAPVNLGVSATLSLGPGHVSLIGDGRILTESVSVDSLVRVRSDTDVMLVGHRVGGQGRKRNVVSGGGSTVFLEFSKEATTAPLSVGLSTALRADELVIEDRALMGVADHVFVEDDGDVSPVFCVFAVIGFKIIQLSWLLFSFLLPFTCRLSTCVVP